MNLNELKQVLASRHPGSIQCIFADHAHSQEYATVHVPCLPLDTPPDTYEYNGRPYKFIGRNVFAEPIYVLNA